FLVSSSCGHRDLSSFPTRRSSDLVWCVGGREQLGKTQDPASRRAVQVRHVDLHLVNSLRSKNQLGFGAWRKGCEVGRGRPCRFVDRKSTRLNSSHVSSSYAVFCLK